MTITPELTARRAQNLRHQHARRQRLRAAGLSTEGLPRKREPVRLGIGSYVADPNGYMRRYRVVRPQSRRARR